MDFRIIMKMICASVPPIMSDYNLNPVPAFPYQVQKDRLISDIYVTGSSRLRSSSRRQIAQRYRIDRWKNEDRDQHREDYSAELKDGLHSLVNDFLNSKKIRFRTFIQTAH